MCVYIHSGIYIYCVCMYVCMWVYVCICIRSLIFLPQTSKHHDHVVCKFLRILFLLQKIKYVLHLGYRRTLYIEGFIIRTRKSAVGIKGLKITATEGKL
jgi:hypothetical protein